MKLNERKKLKKERKNALIQTSISISVLPPNTEKAFSQFNEEHLSIGSSMRKFRAAFFAIFACSELFGSENVSPGEAHYGFYFLSDIDTCKMLT